MAKTSHELAPTTPTSGRHNTRAHCYPHACRPGLRLLPNACPMHALCMHAALGFVSSAKVATKEMTAWPFWPLQPGAHACKKCNHRAPAEPEERLVLSCF